MYFEFVSLTTHKLNAESNILRRNLLSSLKEVLSQVPTIETTDTLYFENSFYFRKWELMTLFLRPVRNLAWKYGELRWEILIYLCLRLLSRNFAAFSERVRNLST